MADPEQMEVEELLGEVRPLQERYGRGDPWRVLVICLLLNQTDGRVVARQLPAFFERFPVAPALAAAGSDAVAALLEPLGMHHRRGRLLVQLSRAYVREGWEDPLELPGVGSYAREAWRLFVEEDPEFQPQDPVLRAVATRMRKGLRPEGEPW